MGFGTARVLALVVALPLLSAGTVLAGAPPEAACEGRQLKAAAKLCKSLLGCAAKETKKPEFDRASCALGAEARFAGAWDRALAKAARKGTQCGQQESAALAAARVRTRADGLAAELTAGLNASDPADVALRRSLLKGAGAYCGGALKAFARDAVKPKREKLGRQSGKARGKLLRSAERAIANANGAGVFAPALDGIEIIVDVDILAAQIDNAFAAPRVYSDRIGFTNAGDSRLIGWTDSVGRFQEVVGTRDADGLPTGVQFLQQTGPEGTDVIELDPLGRPIGATAADGTSFQLTWLTDTSALL